MQDRCGYLENAYFQDIHHIYYTTYKTSMCMIDVVIEILPAFEFLIAFITLICIWCLFPPFDIRSDAHKDVITTDGPSFKTTSANNPVVHVKGVKARNDDNEPFENYTKLCECQDMVDVKVGSDAHNVVLKLEGPCFKSIAAKTHSFARGGV